MKKVCISDRTLTETNRAVQNPLSFKEKIEIARLLSNLHVDAIELPPLKNVRTDTLFVRTISSFVKDSALSLSAGMTEQSVQEAADALSGAAHGRLRIELPLSPVQMEYKCHLKAPGVAELAETLTRAAAARCEDVEFCAVDCTRAEKEFLCGVLAAVVRAGAKTVTLCDNDATMLPEEFGAFVRETLAAAPELAEVTVGVLCDNKYGLALASAVASLPAGVTLVKTAVSAPQLLAFNDWVNLLRSCAQKLDVCTTVNMAEAGRLSAQISRIADERAADQKKSAIPALAAATGSEISLTKNDDLPAIAAAIKKLGYDLSEEDTAKVYEAFCRVAVKKNVTLKELEAIIASAAFQVPPAYRLVSYVINNGNLIGATAYIKLEKDGKEYEGLSAGDGPIDAALLAIEQIIGHHYELDDFQIQTVTEGREAMGSALVRLRSGGKLYSGNGISTDIIGSSIRAYMNALNKIKYEESQV